MTDLTDSDSSQSKASRIVKLKEAGNALYQQGELLAAYDKYSQAIDEDPQNAVLFANRAAACLAMQRYDSCRYFGVLLMSRLHLEDTSTLRLIPSRSVVPLTQRIMLSQCESGC